MRITCNAYRSIGCHYYATMCHRTVYGSSFLLYKFTGQEIMTAQYTQVVWAQTRFVGCGRRKFQNDPFCVEHYVCNYGPHMKLLGITTLLYRRTLHPVP
jgi:hypothetical protein